MNLSAESKRILKHNVEEIQKKKKVIEAELNTVTRDIGRNQTKERELRDKIKTMDKQVQNINKDMNAQ